jgi:hypothetical protein
MLGCWIGVVSVDRAAAAPIEIVVEDGFDRAVGPGADLEGALGRRLEALGAVVPRQPDDPQAGPVALLGMGPRFQDPFAQRRRRRPDPLRVGADALDRPAGVASVAGRHVLGERRVLAIAAAAGMSGDPFAPEKDLDGPRRQPRLDLGAQKTMRDAVIVEGDLDMIVDADAALLPFRVLVGLRRQRLQRRTIDLFQQASACRAEPADRPNVVEAGHEIADRGVDLRQAMEGSMAQPPDEPALNDQYRLFNL